MTHSHHENGRVIVAKEGIFTTSDGNNMNATSGMKNDIHQQDEDDGKPSQHVDKKRRIATILAHPLLENEDILPRVWNFLDVVSCRCLMACGKSFARWDLLALSTKSYEYILPERMDRHRSACLVQCARVKLADVKNVRFDQYRSVKELTIDYDDDITCILTDNQVQELKQIPHVTVIMEDSWTDGQVFFHGFQNIRKLSVQVDADFADVHLDQSLAFIQSLHGLQYLKLIDLPMDYPLNCLNCLSRLEELNVNDSAIHVDKDKPLHLPSLRKLDFKNNFAFDMRQAVSSETLGALTSLTLYGGVSYNGVLYRCDLSPCVAGLEELYLRNVVLATNVTSFQQLRELSYWDVVCPTPPSFQDMPNMRKLEYHNDACIGELSSNLKDLTIKATSWATVVRQPQLQLKRLRIVDDIGASKDYPTAGALETLEELDIHSPVMNPFFSQLANLKCLRLVINRTLFENGSILDSILCDIGKLKQLHDLELYINFWQLSTFWPPRVPSFLKDLHNLTVLDMSTMDISTLEPLQDLVRLKSLSIWSTIITSLKPLCNLTKLETLNIDCPKAWDVTPLGSLQRLVQLRVPLKTRNVSQLIEELPFVTEIRCVGLDCDEDSSTVRDSDDDSSSEWDSDDDVDFEFFRTLDEI